MEMNERLEMYREKRNFINRLNAAFHPTPKGSTVTEISYEVYQKEYKDRLTFCEWIIVHFIGGGKSPRRVSGNSNTANLRVVGELVDGGYYDEVADYNIMSTSKDYELVFLATDTISLRDLLAKPMTHISDVRKCFNYCRTEEDVEEVIESIPRKFGDFDVEFSCDGETFTIINSFQEDGEPQFEEAEYEFYSDNK